MTEWYWVDTRWACGGIEVRDGKIVGGAPIFRKFRGQPFMSVMRGGRYRFERLQDHG